MAVQRQTPEATASPDGTTLRRPQASSAGGQASRGNEGFDLTRFSPLQIAAELARRSHAPRFTTDTTGTETVGTEEISAGKTDSNDSDAHPALTGATGAASAHQATSEAAPFDRLSQALSPTMEERRRLKQQYVEARYLWEEEQDRQEAHKLREELPGEELPREELPGEQVPPDERRGPAFAADSRFAARKDLPHVESRTPPQNAIPDNAILAGRAAIDRPAVEIRPSGRASQESRQEQDSRWEPRLAAISAEELRSVLRAPDDVRGVITTSFDRPLRSGEQAPFGQMPRRHRHGALFLLVALAIGATLYFHPWTSGEEGPVRSDLSLNTAAGNAGAHNTATNSAAGPAPVSPPARSAEQVAATPAKPSAAKPTDPSPAAEMTPLSGQSAPLQPAPAPAAPSPMTGAPVAGPLADKAGDARQPADVQDKDAQDKNVQAGKAVPDVAAGKAPENAADTAAISPQAMPQPVEPKQSFAPAGTITLPQGTPKTALPAQEDAQAPATTSTARPVGSKSQGQASRSRIEVKPSPAWLHVQPYGGAGATAPDATSPGNGGDTPDAWMKPQPYREPGVLTPPN